jgi:predicted TPR repeat methyltransferase
MGDENDNPGRVSAAIALHRNGQLEEAEKIYRALLEADPGNVDALHFMGVMRHQQGRTLQALELVSRAITLRPDYVDAINNLGNIHQQLGASIQAVVAYRQVLELRPDHPDALRNLGIALRSLKRFEEAVELHERAVERWPEALEHYYALANAYKDLLRFDDALATLRKALAIRPEAEGYRRLGQFLYTLRRKDEAVANYEAWLRAEPANPVPRHMLAAWTLKDVPGRAGDEFVVSTFDGFAESFDDVLMGRLEYRAPALVGEALKRIEGEPRGALDVVDAGCGTGLLARHLRPYARLLVGVDLSPKMLQKARPRGYDRLIAVELASFLRSERQAFDVVASSDTLVYFGDLREVLAAARIALRPGGRLVFTLEHSLGGQDAAPGYRIQPHGRYTHSEAYVRGRLAEAGFELIEIERVHLRREGGRYVEGLLVAARAALAAAS